MSGLVTLALLAILCAYLVPRALRRIGMTLSKNNTIGLVVVFVIVVLMLWGQSLQK